jgi:cardiolipin synthase
MTTANKITIIRILLIPLFIAEGLYFIETGREWHRYVAIAAFGFAAVSDAVDGFVARHFNQRSELGAILDPLADKLLLVSGIVLLSFPNQGHLPQLPLWMTATVVGRDVVLLIGLVVMHYIGAKVTVRPHIIGKVATVLQMTAVLWSLLRFDGGWLFVLTLAATLCTAGSGVLYVLDGVNQLSASPASSASPKQ